MLKFLKESFINKKNRPLSFFINWLGMTLGLTAVIVIYLYIMQEVRHDKGVYATEIENVYRVEMEGELGSITPTGLRRAAIDMPEVAGGVRVLQSEFVVATEGESATKIFNLQCMATDTTLFSVLPFRLASGNPETAMSDQNSIIISRSAARKLFGTEDVIGKMVKIDNTHPGTVSAVMEDVPINSSYTPEIIFSLDMMLKIAGWDSKISGLDNNWGHWNYELYLKLADNINIDTFAPKFEKEVQAKISKSWGNEFKSKVTLRNFDDVYFASDTKYSFARSVDADNLWVMAMIALLTLVIAIINYVNIYTARSTEVIRAMGIKSIFGARRVQLIGFVIFDSVLITLISAVSAFCLAVTLKPFYADIVGSEVVFNLQWDILLALFVGIPLVCGVISGIFPALALTRMKPLDSLSNRSSGSRVMGAVRNSLIIFQFAISITLIGCTIFINKQMDYITTMDMGYNRENIVCVRGDSFLGAKFSTFKNKLLENPEITGVSFMSTIPVQVGEMMTIQWGDGKSGQYSPNVLWTDENGLDLMGIEMIEGEMFRDDIERTAEKINFVINEAMAEKIRETVPDVTFPYKQFRGVFKNFQNRSVKEATTPLAVGSIWRWNNPSPYGMAAIKISGRNLDKTMDHIKKCFDEVCSGELYSFKFMDDAFNELYTNEQQIRLRLLMFSLLAIFIGCLGLFALVGYSVERRRSEIAIRKVYGASIVGVIMMLCAGFLRWLLIAFVIASPIIYYISTSWAEQFQFRTEISWWIFAVSLAVTLCIALVTVIGQTYIAATENPAKAVKSK